METGRSVIIGLRGEPNMSIYLNSHPKELIDYVSNKINYQGRVATTLAEYLVNYTKTFDSAKILIYPSMGNAIITLNQSKVDIIATMQGMIGQTLEMGDFAYPLQMYDDSFMTQKPQYKPHISGILQTFPLSMWIAIISVLIILSSIYYATLKWKYSPDKIFIHVLAVLLRQSSILRPSSTAETALIYSWVVGAMFICLAYDSVFLSFLAIPPVNTVKDASQLARVVANGEYHCASLDKRSMKEVLLSSTRQELRTIALGFDKNNFSADDILNFPDRNGPNLCVVAPTHVLNIFKVGKNFVSDDRFMEVLGSMMIGREFCCKKLIDTFVHRLLSSGLQAKLYGDCNFLHALPVQFRYQERDSTNRKLNLTDVAPAFICLLSGYFLSFIVFIGEILFNRKKKRKYLKRNIKREKRIIHAEDSV